MEDQNRQKISKIIHKEIFTKLAGPRSQPVSTNIVVPTHSATTVHGGDHILRFFINTIQTTLCSSLQEDIHAAEAVGEGSIGRSRGTTGPRDNPSWLSRSCTCPLRYSNVPLRNWCESLLSIYVAPFQNR